MQTSYQTNDKDVINAIHEVDGDNVLKKSSQGLDTYIFLLNYINIKPTNLRLDKS